MRLSTEELKNNPNLLRLMSDEGLESIGLNPQAIKSSTKNISAGADPKNPLSLLSPTALRHLRGQEKAQHITFSNWLSLHNHRFLHAPTYRKVHDLPPGWPDFTLFKSILDLNYALFIEFKSPWSGKLSKEQLAFRKSAFVHVSYSALDAINLAKDFFQ
jgi:hypothetical protein